MGVPPPPRALIQRIPAGLSSTVACLDITRNLSWSLMRMQSCNRPIAETVEAGHLYQSLPPSTPGNASVNSNSAHPPSGPSPGSKLANAPPPGQKSCSNAPGYGLKNVLFSSFLDLLSIKSKTCKLIHAKV